MGVAKYPEALKMGRFSVASLPLSFIFKANPKVLAI